MNLLEDYKKITIFIRKLYNRPLGTIPLHAPVFKGNEKKYLEECIETSYVSSVGKFVDQFEVGMANYMGVKKAVACVNGTNALHLALKLVNVGPESEVITQPLTFVATANAISYCGARSIFLDVDLDTMGLSPLALKNWLEKNIEVKQNIKFKDSNLRAFNRITGKHVSACVPVHTYGHPCRISEIVEICSNYYIPVIEDASESLGSYYRRKLTGTFGRIGVLSFNGNKILTTGGGGMLLFNDEELANKAKHLTTQAKIPHLWEFSHDEIGYNYRMPNINAALGLAQLEHLPAFLKSKRQIAESYLCFFSNDSFISPITFIKEPLNSRSNFWLNCILMENKVERDAFLKYSNENGVMTRPAWLLMNNLPMFLNCESDSLKNAKDLADRLVNLPSGVNMQDEDLNILI